MKTNPFESIDSAHQYVSLLRETVTEVEGEIKAEIEAAGCLETRQKKALQLIAYKLTRLEQHLRSSRLILNDLRTLRNLLLKEPDDALDGRDVLVHAHAPAMSAENARSSSL